MFQPRPQYLLYVLFAAFSLSGFSGLIYESVWTNYLKFFLGHAAHAQALVLSMFMGGMAGGAWLAGKYVPRMRNPLMGYVVVELIIGAFGLLFHSIFVGAHAFMFDRLLPGIESVWGIEALRWLFAAVLILPQTLLLGATFPLMSIGILRAFPDAPGGSISMLYFTNSIGAVAGVLTSGFLLIGLVGLPGTIMTAGLVNFLLALIVFAIQKRLVPAAIAPPAQDSAQSLLMRPILAIALITGMASFIYEISWIRMLGVITGASTHAFELMLSAFILGLALGGLWLRKRIDRFERPLIALGIIQLLMGLMALSTVLSYNQLMLIMGRVFRSIQPTETGYLLYNTGSQLAALVVMLPTTFLAGMTLPLITLILFRGGAGESAIGKVYAFNTLGAILGVVAASMFLLPMVGLKMAILAGAVLDMGLALYLLGRGGAARGGQLAAWGAVAASIVAGFITPPFDSTRMASSIFRTDRTIDTASQTSALHVDGRTASVDVVRTTDGVLILSTNGKPDATYVPEPAAPSGDEPTQVLLGALPIMLKPDARHIAVIGMGAGMSANVTLTSKSLERLDIIEIEAAMVDAARLFGKASARVFSDPRSRIHIDDAKSYFAARKERYDVIISEPSDTWVSGVSSLFTDEFYARMRGHLKDDGILVQWVANYHSSPQLVASKMRALSKNFSDYRVYVATDKVMVVVARKNGALQELDERSFDNGALARELQRVGWRGMEDVHRHEAGRRALIDPYFQHANAPANSDFFPFVDQNGHKARILTTPFNDLTMLYDSGVPVPGPHFDRPSTDDLTGFAGTYYAARRRAHLGAKFIHAMRNPQAPYNFGGDDYAMLTVLNTKPRCDELIAQQAWSDALIGVAKLIIPFHSAKQATPFFDSLLPRLCDSAEARISRETLALASALAARDMPATQKAAASVLVNMHAHSIAARNFAIDATLLSLYQQKKWNELGTFLQGLHVKRTTLADVIAAQLLEHMRQRR